MSDESVAELVARCREGDSQAETLLFERHLQSLLALVRARISTRLAPRFDAEDVVQSAFRSFFGGLDRGEFEVEGEVALWGLLAAITMHKLHRQVAHHHAQKRSVLNEQPLEDEGRLRGLRPEVAAEEPTPDEAAALVEEVERIMKTLNPLQRRMLELRLQGYTIEEIAGQTKRSDRTVQRLLEKLKDELELRLRQSRNA